MSETDNAATDFWARNTVGGKKTFLSGDAKKLWAANGTVFTILRIAERVFNDRRTGMPVHQWALSVQGNPGEPVYTLTLGKTEGRDEFMQNMRDFIAEYAPIQACLDYVTPKDGNGFYVFLDPDAHPAHARQSLDLQ